MKVLGKIVLVIFVLSLGLFVFAEIREKLRPTPAPPTIVSSLDAIEIPCNYTNEQIMQGLTASGEKDGDLTDQIMVGNISRFKEKGVSTVTYVVFDSDNQPSTYQRQVTFTDYRSPEFTLQIPLVFTCGDFYGVENYVGATDVFFGDINNAVRFEDNNINFNTPGDYYMTVEAANAYGDIASQQLPVHIVSTEELRLQINLTQGLIYLDKGASFSPESYIRSVSTSEGASLSNSLVSYRSNVDVHNAGVYEVKYTASSDGMRGVNWLTVIVRE